MAISGQAVSRHLVFVLEDNKIVLQRGANLVEVLGTHQQLVFSSSDYHHNITNAELDDLIVRGLVVSYDDGTVWLPEYDGSNTDLGTARYYFLDTKLSAPYLRIVESLLETVHFKDSYVAQVFDDRVAIMGVNGEPFPSLNDAEEAYTILMKVLGDQLISLSINSHEVDTTLYDSQIKGPGWQRNLVSQVHLPTLAERTVLIIDHNEQQAQRIGMSLAERDVQVRIAKTGEHALEILMDDEADIILLNLNLPDLHGYQVIAAIKKNPLTANIPLIVLSSSSSETDIAFALYVAKVDDYIVKPIEPSRIRQRVINILSRPLY